MNGKIQIKGTEIQNNSQNIVAIKKAMQKQFSNTNKNMEKWKISQEYESQKIGS